MKRLILALVIINAWTLAWTATYYVIVMLWMTAV
jgi:hypothetical protein